MISESRDWVCIECHWRDEPGNLRELSKHTKPRVVNEKVMLVVMYIWSQAWQCVKRRSLRSKPKK